MAPAIRRGAGDGIRMHEGWFANSIIGFEVLGSHWLWIAILLLVVLIVFGPGRLPELGGAVGKAMREFRKATSELTNEVTTAVQLRPAPPAPTPAGSTEGAAQGSTTSEAKPGQS